MLVKHHMFGLLLLVISGIFSYRLYNNAPWQLDVNDFLIQPIIQFALPLALLGLVLLFLPPSLWVKNIFFVLLLGTSTIVLLVEGGWLLPSRSTSWEDSYQTLFVLEVAIRVFFWPAWIITVVYALRFLRARRKL